MNSTTGTILNDEYGGDGNNDNSTQETQDNKDNKDDTRRSGWDGKANSKKNVMTKLLAMKQNVTSGRRTDSSQM